MYMHKTIRKKESHMNIRSKITSEKLALFEAQIQKNKQLPGPLMPTLQLWLDQMLRRQGR